ncbi:MAG: hypothetical protein MK212_03030 [Saprospiraceae bacterium]|nr:hypothetical protein [Saprospiraceae bacterium]
MIQQGKKVIYAIWGLFIVFLIIAYIQNPAIATPEYLVDYIRSYNDEMFWVYVLLTFLRGLFLIPSTPFVIGGGILFPDDLLLVLVISMLGIMFSATGLYYFADLLGFSKYLENSNSKGIEKWKKCSKAENLLGLYSLGLSFP